MMERVDPAATLAWPLIKHSVSSLDECNGKD